MTVILQVVVIVVGVCLLVSTIVLSWAKLRKQRQRSWHDLVADLYSLELDELHVVASDYLNPICGQITLEADEIWEIVGGYEGLKKMCENATIMLDLAAHAQRWNYLEASVVTERMRHDAVILRGAVLRVELGLLSGRMMKRFQVALPIRTQEAAAAYFLMRQRLLSLYECCNSDLYPSLANALQ
jgi:hypothetical protein